MAQLWPNPGATAVKRSSAPTDAGVEIRLLAPVPSCPWSFPPQQKARPSTPTRHVCRPPATMLTFERLGGGPIAASTDSDGGTDRAGVGGADVGGAGLGGVDLGTVPEAGALADGLGSRTTPTGASGAPTAPLDVSAMESGSGGAI